MTTIIMITNNNYCNLKTFAWVEIYRLVLSTKDKPTMNPLSVGKEVSRIAWVRHGQSIVQTSYVRRDWHDIRMALKLADVHGWISKRYDNVCRKNSPDGSFPGNETVN